MHFDHKVDLESLYKSAFFMQGNTSTRGRFYYSSVMFRVQLWVQQPDAENSKHISMLWKGGCGAINYGIELSPFLFIKDGPACPMLKEARKEAQKYLSLIFRELKQLLLQILLGNPPPKKLKIKFIYLVPTRSNSHLKVLHIGN